MRLAALPGAGQPVRALARIDALRNRVANPILASKGLKARQIDVLRLVCAGLRNVEIAERLKMSERGVKWYVSELLLHFGVKNRTELAAIAASNLGHNPKKM
jgi:DNA-binding NarL/FixJ family response regulator